MNLSQILDDLDKHASEFNFPVLDNAYVEFGAARLTALRGAEDWLIVFEVLGFSKREGEFVVDLYAFGSCVEREGFIGEEIPIASSHGLPLFDPETNQCIADWSHWAIKLGNEVVSFSPTREDYAKAGIAIERDRGPGTLSEIELLRFLVYRIGKERLFMSDAFLLARFPRCMKVSTFVQTTQWQHPDVAGGEKPSENVSISSLVQSLLRGDPSLFNQGLPNTDWKSWPEIE